MGTITWIYEYYIMNFNFIKLKRRNIFILYNKTLIMLCIPIIIQNLISTLVNMVDTVMVGSLGEVSVASIGIANQYFFLFNTLCIYTQL